MFCADTACLSLASFFSGKSHSTVMSVLCCSPFQTYGSLRLRSEWFSSSLYCVYMENGDEEELGTLAGWLADMKNVRWMRKGRVLKSLQVNGNRCQARVKNWKNIWWWGGGRGWWWWGEYTKEVIFSWSEKWVNTNWPFSSFFISYFLRIECVFCWYLVSWKGMDFLDSVMFLFIFPWKGVEIRTFNPEHNLV